MDDMIDPLGGFWEAFRRLAHQPLFAPGDEVGGFQIVAELGRGGQGEVYAAWDPVARRFVALKFVRPAAVPTTVVQTAPLYDHQLITEARRATRLNLPDVVAVHAIGRDGGHTFLVLDYAAGRSLAAWRKDPRIGARLLVRLALPVGEALAAAHDLSLVHYDVKPDNLLLLDPYPPTSADDGPPPELPDRRDVDPHRLRMAVSDFGLARLGAAGGTPRGTLGFEAPEQRNPERDVLPAGSVRRAAAIDGFGLAASLFVMLTGDKDGPSYHTPYARPDPKRLTDAGVDQNLAAVLLKELDPDPRNRYPTVQAFADDLRRWLDGEPVTARPYLPARQLKRAFTRQPKWVKAVLALLPVALVALAAVWVGKAEAERETAEEGRLKAEAQGELQATLAEQIARDFKNAVALEAERKLAEHDAVVFAARTAARRGAWAVALAEYDKAIRTAATLERRRADVVRLRVERLFGYFATNDEAALTRELDALEKEPLGPLAPKVMLVRGAHRLCDGGQTAAGRSAVRAALTQRGRLNTPGDVFTPADVAYAEALVETQPGPVVAALRRAIATDALHYPAHTALLFALIGDGDLKAARGQCDLLEGLFPDSASPAAARALLAIYEEGNRAAMRHHVAQFQARRGVKPDNPIRFFEKLADLQDLMEKFNLTIRLDPVNAAVLARKMGVLMADVMQAKKPFAFGVPVVHLLAAAQLQLVENFHQQGDEAFMRLMALSQTHSDAMFLVAAAANRWVEAARAAGGGDLGEARQHVRLAADLCYQADRRPTSIPRSPIRFQTWAAGLKADILLLKLPDPAPIHLQRLRGCADRLFGPEGDRWGPVQYKEVEQLLQVITVPSAAALPEANRQLHALGQLLLAAWAERKPMHEPLGVLTTRFKSWAQNVGLGSMPAPATGLALAPAPRPK